MFTSTPTPALRMAKLRKAATARAIWSIAPAGVDEGLVLDCIQQGLSPQQALERFQRAQATNQPQAA